MRRIFTNFMLVLGFWFSTYQFFGQCDQDFYSDLSGPCATSVCGYDDYCCNVEWDFVCSAEAASDPNCVYCWAECHDNDFDNYTNCDGDCDDFDAAIHPNSFDICGNGIDEDCNGSDNIDACDNLGYTNLASPCGVAICDFDSYCCETEWDFICVSEALIITECQDCWCGCYDNDLDLYSNCDGDCDDFDNFTYPGATEICDGVDNDCNGIVDDGLTTPYFADDDGDGYGDPLDMIESCFPIFGYVLNDEDCDDGDTSINPDGLELCSNSSDDDCDGTIDNVSGRCDVAGFTDLAGPCAVSVCAADPFCCSTAWDELCAAEAAANGNCDYCLCGCYDNDFDGYTNCDGDCDDFNPNVNPAETEVCFDNYDNDCSGLVDDATSSCDALDYADLAGPCATSVCDYDPFCCNTAWDNFCAAEAASDENCAYCICGCYDNDLDGYTNCNGDCNDYDSQINVLGTEICDDVDNNCDGDIDEGLLNTYYEDSDGDGFGTITSTTLACSLPSGYSLDASDCDDSNIFINPLGTEVCNGIDDDCSNGIDDGVLNTYYFDSDGDGFGDATATTLACSQPSGYVNNANDCDDSDELINPLASESCNNGADDDCDGSIDESTTACDRVGYADLAGPCAISICEDDPFCCNVAWDNVCAGQSLLRSECQYCWCDCYDNDLDGVTNCDGDCDDFNANTYPGADEICDSQDNDCDGDSDEGLTFSTYYMDDDGDGYGDPAVTIVACQLPFPYSANNLDCDDTNAAIRPLAFESCNGIDDDCDGSIDEGALITYYADADGDGYGDPSNSVQDCNQPLGYALNNSDCDDSNADVNPTQLEICANGIDDDCDALTSDGSTNTYYADDDGDGFGDASVTTTSCTAPTGYVSDDTDCDDSDANIYPGALEYCGNGVDDDCDGAIDEVGLNIFYADSDGDGFGDPSTSVDACIAPSGYVIDDTDCDDSDASINPGADEVCNNGADDDCDGDTDELPLLTFYADADGDGYGDASSSVDDCTQPSGYVTDDSDCDDTDENVNPDVAEDCNNGIDDDCDGDTDEGGSNTYFADADGDGYGDASDSVTDCTQPLGYVTDDTDCDDTDENINPGVAEDCSNGIDDDCDGDTDEGGSNTYYADADGDGYGDASVSVTDCTQPLGYVTDDTDCDDTDENVNPGVAEDCSNGIDDDCDGDTDEGGSNTYYADADGDGYGDASVSVTDCTQPLGYVTDDTDCDDTDENVNPGVAEDCSNGIDDDCDGDTDEGGSNTYFADDDGDGYGDASVSVTDCTQPLGYVTDDTDCDDTDENVNPGVAEDCSNGIDDDCDGDTDEGGSNTYYADADGDGYGDASVSVTDCTQPLGYVTDDTDCDDTDASVNPGATELCGNGVDDDCDGNTDNAAANTYYADADDDGYGDPSDSVVACTAPSGYVGDDTDCDDTDASINPGADEVCNNGADDNCDGNTDELPLITFYADVDGDGYGDASSSVDDCSQPLGYVTDDTDCDDTDENVNPGATEVCDNSTDDDCDGNIDNVAANTYYADADGDGYGDASTSTTACTAPSGYVTDSTDCDDADENVNPGTAEVCNNGVDDNCSGAIDELALATYYMDADGDGYGDPSSSVEDCEQPSGYVVDGTDCDDTNADVYPGATEVCNEVDDDCDSTSDEDIVFVMYYADSDGDGYGDPAVTMESCVSMAGYVTDNTDCDDADSSVNPAATEVCDDADNDCDGSIDEDLTLSTYYTDADGDGYGADLLGDFCSPPANATTVDGDCDDANANVNPDESESCDGIDNDCNGNIDDNVVYVDYFEDMDGDGFGDVFLGNLCVAPDNSATTSGDCDDSNEEINPDATEICNDTDDNCDELIDEGLEYADYYSDDDGDGFGDELIGSFCAAPSNSSLVSGDCDDTNGLINPGSVEFCNEIDDNCDEAIDNDVSYFDYYSDMDGDGYGGDYLGNFCLPPADAVTNSNDCDDTDSGVHPNAPEFCDNIDNNCNEAIDEGLITFTYYADNDGDAVGGDLLGDFCSAPANSSLINGDCNDSDANVYPGADEVCNSEDDNCNEAVDEGVLNSYYEDADGDTYGDIAGLVLSCSAPTGYVENSDDCDDDDDNINPDAIEFCDGIDNDCNGLIDDNCIDSVEEISTIWSVQLYPNPAHDQLSVTISGVSGSLEYTIHDAVGRLIIRSKLNGSEVVNQIDCSQLSQGSYTIAVHNGTEQVISKFVKL